MTSASIARAVSVTSAVLLAGTLHADTLYWGGTATSGSVPTTVAGLTATWDNSTTNWATDRAGTSYQAWADNAIANLGYFTDASGNAVITIDGNKTITGMVASLTAASSFNRLFTLNGSGAGTTLTLSGDTARFLIAGTSTTNGVQLNATAGTNLSLGASTTTLLKDGNGSLFLGNFSNFVSNDAFTGKVDIRSGSLTLQPQTSFNGVTDFTLTGYRPSIVTTGANGNQGFTAPQLTINLASSAGTSNRINDNAVITLANRGTLELRSGGNTGIENIGGVVLDKGVGILNISTGNAGQIVNFNTFTRGANTTMVVNVSSADELKPRVRITNLGALTTDTLLPWLSTNRGEWVMIDSTNSNQLTRVTSTNASLDASVWDTTYTGTSNVRINGVMTNSLDANLALNSLSFLGTGTASNLDLGGNTLTLNAGALGLGPNGSVAYTLSNGSLTSGTSDLYINTGNSNTSQLVLDTTLTGTMDIYVTGTTIVTFGPKDRAAGTPNYYTGTVYVNSGTVEVNKDAAITGDVVIAGGGGMVINRAAGIATNSNITLARDGFLNFSDQAPTLGGVLTVNGGEVLFINQPDGPVFNNPGTGLVFNGGLLVHNSGATNHLNLLTNVSYAGSSETQAVIRKVGSANFTVRLNSGTNAGNAERTFNIANSGTLAADIPEMLIDVPIENGGSGTTTGSLKKTGDGTLLLTAANTYTGGTTIDGGTLHLGSITAAAQSNLTGTFSNSGVEAEILTFAEPITGSMAVGQTVTGTNINTNRQIVAILDDYRVILSGSVGTNTNKAATDIALGAVSRVGSLAGDVTVNNTGTLRIDAGSSVAGNVTVNTGGTLKGNGTVGGNVTVNTGGTVAPGNSVGTLNVSTDATFTTGSIFDIEIASASSFDQLVVSGAGLFNGNINVSFLDNFEPVAADIFTIIAGSNVTGTVGNLNGSGKLPVPGGTFDVLFDSAGLKLTNFTATISFILGDMNNDNAVNNQDIGPFVLALTNYPQYQIDYPGLDGVARGDINQDTILNNQDIAPFVALLTGPRPLAELANDPDFAPLIALVPEPAALSLLALGGLALRRRRGR